MGDLDQDDPDRLNDSMYLDDLLEAAGENPATVAAVAIATPPVPPPRPSKPTRSLPAVPPAVPPPLPGASSGSPPKAVPPPLPKKKSKFGATMIFGLPKEAMDISSESLPEKSPPPRIVKKPSGDEHHAGSPGSPKKKSLASRASGPAQLGSSFGSGKVIPDMPSSPKAKREESTTSPPPLPPKRLLTSTSTLGDAGAKHPPVKLPALSSSESKPSSVKSVVTAPSSSGSELKEEPLHWASLIYSCDIIEDQMNCGAKTIEKLIRFFEKFTKLQQSFGQEVLKLCDKDKDAPPIGDRFRSVNSVTNTVYSQMRAFAQANLEQSSILEKNVVEKLNTLFSEYKSKKKPEVDAMKATESDISKARTNVSGLKAKALKASETYYLEKDKDKKEKKLFGGSADPLKTAQQALSKYEESVVAAQSLAETAASKKIPAILSKLEELEFHRCSQLSLHLVEVGKIMENFSTQVSGISATISNGVTKITAQKDSNEIVSKYMSLGGDLKKYVFSYELSVTADTLSSSSAVNAVSGSSAPVAPISASSTPFPIFGGAVSDSASVSASTTSKVSLEGKFSLATYMQDQLKENPDYFLPITFMKLRAIIKKKGGFSCEGIFRISPAKSEFLAYMEKVGQKDFSYSGRDPHVPAAAMKNWLRNLKSPLIPSHLYDSIITGPLRAADVTRLVNSMGEYEYYLLMGIAQLCREVSSAKYIKSNKMTMSNLAVVFATGILRPEKEEKEITSAIFQSKQTAKAVAKILTQMEVDERYLSMDFDDYFAEPPELSLERSSSKGLEDGASLDEESKIFDEISKALDLENSSALPAGWIEAKDGEGNVYYYNESSNVTQWERP